MSKITEYGGDKIAIAGMAGLFPGAPNLNAFYGNIINNKSAIVNADEDWLAGALTNSTVNRPARIRSSLRAGIGDIAFFNPISFGIIPKSVDGGDPDHYLSLRVAAQALNDANIPEEYDHTNTGVIIGRGTYFNRGFGTVFQHGIIVNQTMEILGKFLPREQLVEIEQQLIASLPSFNADMVGGVVPNIVSGRIANKLGLGGPNFLIDAACASSLIAIEHACEELILNKVDMMLVGGVQASTPPQVHMVFDLLDALAVNKISPFSKNAEGTVLSEGIGFVVLCRLADAERLNLTPYAIIEAVASSSDGRGKGLFAPSTLGQQLAISRAYKGKDALKSQVRYIETHGTGMPLGDQVEIETIYSQFIKPAPDQKLHLASLKALIGHCIPASGIGGVMSAALAVKNGIYPGFALEDPLDLLQSYNSSLRYSPRPLPWFGSHQKPRTAAVNAFGFGGVNSHLVLSQYSPAATDLDIHSDAPWSASIFFFSSPTLAGLLQEIDIIIHRLRQGAFYQAAIESLLRAQEESEVNHSIYKGFVTASSAQDAAVRLENLQAKISLKLQENQPAITYRHRLGHSSLCGPLDPQHKPDIVFVYPGEGSQASGMLNELSMYFPLVNQWLSTITDALGISLDQLEEIVHSSSNRKLPEDAYEINFSTGVVFAANMALNQLLRSWGVVPAAHVGHSTGQNTSLFASGWIHCDKNGSVLSAAASQALAMKTAWKGISHHESLEDSHCVYVLQQPNTLTLSTLCDLHPDKILISMRNCPDQYVVVVPSVFAKDIKPLLQESCVLLLDMPISRPYHTKHFSASSSEMKSFYSTSLRYQSTSSEPVYSCTSASKVASSRQAEEELSGLMESPVNFEKAVQIIAEDGYKVFVECGNGSTTSSFIRSILKNHDNIEVVSTQPSSKSNLASFLQAIGSLWILGQRVSSQYLESQAQKEHTAQAASVCQPGEMKLNLLMPRASLTHISSQPSVSVPHASPRSPHTPREASSPVRDRITRLSADVSINNSSPLLRHHSLPNRNCYHSNISATGLQVVPMAFFIGLTWSTLKRTASSQAITLRNITMTRWAEALLQNQFKINIEDHQSGGSSCNILINQNQVFSCEVATENSIPNPSVRGIPPSEGPMRNQSYIWPADEFYSHGMFHGPFYQVVKSIDHCDATSIYGTIATSTDSADYNIIQVLDGLAQCAAFWAAPLLGLNFHTFPTRIDDLTVFNIAPAPASYLFRIRKSHQGPQGLTFDGSVYSGSNLVLAFTGFSHSLIRLPTKYHECFAHCESSYFTQVVDKLPAHVSISVVEDIHILDKCLDSAGFFMGIFTHMWFCDAEREALAGSLQSPVIILKHLAAKECLRALLNKVSIPANARQIVCDRQSSFLWINEADLQPKRLPKPVSLLSGSHYLCISSLTSRVSIVDCPLPSPQELPMDALPSPHIKASINAALRNIIGASFEPSQLQGLKWISRETIRASYSQREVYAGVIRVGHSIYGWSSLV